MHTGSPVVVSPVVESPVLVSPVLVSGVTVVSVVVVSTIGPVVWVGSLDSVVAVPVVGSVVGTTVVGSSVVVTSGPVLAPVLEDASVVSVVPPPLQASAARTGRAKEQGKVRMTARLARGLPGGRLRRTCMRSWGAARRSAWRRRMRAPARPSARPLARPRLPRVSGGKWGQAAQRGPS